jgi:hypothetical protein
MRIHLLAALALTGCASNVPIRAYTYACATTDECAKGFTCIDHVCSTAGSTQDTSVAPDTNTTPDTGDESHCSPSDLTCLMACAQDKCMLLFGKCHGEAECEKALLCYSACPNAACQVDCLTNTSPGAKQSLTALEACLAKHCL